MDNLVKILNSFHPGWKERKYVDSFITILKEMVIPTYSFLDAKIENNRAVFPEEWSRILSALKEALFFKLFVPVEYGGQKSSEQEIYFMMELLGYASPGLGIIFVSHGRAIDVILSGTKQQKEEYLPKMAEGNFGAIAMTEEKAGSDASAVGLRAERAGDHYLFNGKKIFISNSGLARDYAILANTKGIPGPRSLSVFIVGNDFPGLTIKGLPEKDGLRILPTGELIFKNTPVPVKNLVGNEGMGLLLTLDVIDRGRIHIAGICCGLACRIFHEIYFYTHRRRQFDHPLTSSQGISFEISDMFTRINAARGLCLHALGQVGTSYYRVSSSQAKLFASQVVMDVATKAQILMGGRGYFKDNLVNQLSADARGMEYLEGTSNIQKMIIAGELFKMYHKERIV
ncbi:MAG: acyl-CoA dehydrogenase [Deltaproteobacteria bacterium]|nr:acyl-CoA dehydrogenase [Deltaproteobacteria bacterium]